MRVQSHSNRHRFGWRGTGTVALVLGVLLNLILAPGVGLAQSAPATPGVGGPGTRFTFSASGFIGDPDDGDDDGANDAERVSFWITTPDGRTIRAIRDGADTNHADNASALRASRAGTVVWEWRAPADAVPGTYTMVAYGLQSERAVSIPFRIDGTTRGELMSNAAAVTPEAGTAGTVFTFVARGFKDDPDDGDDDSTNDAEEVVFWINTPDGTVMEVVRVGADEDADDANQVRAVRSGQVTLRWQAPASAVPGTYSLVAHGLESERNVVIVFAVRG